MISSKVWMDFVRQTDFNKSISLCLCWERGFRFRSADNCCVDTIPGACWAVTVYFARCRLIPGLTTQTGDQMLHVWQETRLLVLNILNLPLHKYRCDEAEMFSCRSSSPDWQDFILINFCADFTRGRSRWEGSIVQNFPISLRFTCCHGNKLN